MDLATNSKNNPKLLYAYVNQNKKIRDSIRTLIDDEGLFTTDPNKITECLNNQFFKVFSEPGNDNDFPRPNEPLHKSCEISEQAFSPQSIYDALKSLDKSKSPGVDKLHPFILNESASGFSKVLSKIYTESYSTSVVPKSWRRANISPIFKKGLKTDPANYRPISLTSIPCKIIEKILKDFIMKHIFENKLINKCQHGFVRFKSCVTNLLETLDIITESLNLGFLVDLILLDFSKAFDLVSHAGLLLKLKSLGLDPKTIKWIESFLKDRKQRVVMGEIMSSWKDVLSGVPQGSVLGPLLFIIYINDMPDLIEHLCKLFADDSKVIAVIKNYQDSERLQTDLDKLVNWAQTWKMKFNHDKCKVMYFGKKNPKTVYKLNNYETGTQVALTETDNERDLGIQLSKDLKWNLQAKKAANKANSVLGMLKRTFMYWNCDSLKTLYTTFVRPHLEYAASAWSPYLSKDIKILESVQRRATKLVPCLRTLSYEERLKRLGLSTLVDRRIRGDMIQYFKCVKGINTVNWFNPNNIANSVGLIGPAGNIRGNKHRINRQFIKNFPQRDHFFTNRIVPYWNELPEEVINSRTVNSFKKKYDKYKIDGCAN